MLRSTAMRRSILALLLLALPCWAQVDGFGKEELIKYTAKNPFERFPDGRPKIPEKYIEMLRGASSEMLWGPLRGAGFEHQWAGDWQIVHPEKKLIGRVVTAVFMPVRPDIDEVIEADAKQRGLGRNDNQRVIDTLQPGDVLVVDMFGKVEDGTFAGDNLAAAIHGASGNGFVIDGGVRDLDGIYPQGFPVYVRGFHVSAIKDVMLMGINVPIRIGRTTVMPGDLVVGDREGLTFIPPHVVQEAAERAKVTELHDIWTKGKLATGKWKASELYPRPSDPKLIEEYEQWLAKEKKKLGIE
ncbi:MAG: dimethylmenaquinone methyltransferase [Acidobacteria bacterium]|nr:dimethylmenaquinone methyltransferase [Acidobacteriota bacterium]